MTDKNISDLKYSPFNASDPPRISTLPELEAAIQGKAVPLYHYMGGHFELLENGLYFVPAKGDHVRILLSTTRRGGDSRQSWGLAMRRKQGMAYSYCRSTLKVMLV